MKRVSAVVCAYNEEKTIRNVLVTIATSEVFDEIIVVNDGSSDSTGHIIKTLKWLNIKDIHLHENKGKGYAMALGIENSTSDIIVFCDADLSELKVEHLRQLVQPIIENEVDMVLGRVSETLKNNKTNHFYPKALSWNNMFKSFTGERTLYKKDILPILDEIKTSKFGVETLINLHYQSHKKKVKYVLLKDLIHPTKFEKINQSQALKELSIEGCQIVSTAFNNYNLILKIIKNKFINTFSS